MDVKSLYENKYAFAGMEVFDAYERNRLLKRIAPGFCKPGMRLVDLGCNDGVVAEYFMRLGLDVAGMDISAAAIARARQRGIKDLRQGDVEQPLPFGDEECDAVFWGDNVEHLFQPLKVLAEVRRVLKPGGILIVSAPNMGCIWYRICYLFSGMIRKTECKDSDPWEWQHIRFFNRRVMQRFLEAGGFKTVRFSGCSSNTVLDLLSRLRPSLFASVMVVVAKKT